MKRAQLLFLLACLGCEANQSQPLSTPDISVIPNITQVLPQIIPAGSASTILKVTGTNFPTQAAILWNGTPVTTTAIDANTLSGTIQSDSLASPATVQVQVQNLQTMQQSAVVPVIISDGTTAMSDSSIFTNLQNSPGWKSSGQLAPAYTDCASDCPGVTWSMTQGISSPSLSGSAAQFNLGGTTPYSDALFYNQLIGVSSTQGLPDNNQTLVPSLHNFTYDAYFYLPDTAHTQAVEFDINWFMNAVAITWGTECRIEGGNEWDIWDNADAKWIPTGFACKPLANAWNHITLTVQRGPNNSVIYQSIALNGVASNINQTFAPYTVPSDWYGITVNFQLDGDQNQTAITSYLDQFSFTYQ